MYIKQFELGRTFVTKLKHNADLLEELNAICASQNIKAGSIKLIGAISSLKLGFYDQTNKEYQYTTYAYDEPMEIVSCSGNISLRDSKPICHIHLVAADKKGKCIGGHLVQGTSLFAGEAIIQEFLGEDLNRELDDTTQLMLWN